MIQWGEQACIDGKPVPLVSCRGMVTPPTNVKYALSDTEEPDAMKVTRPVLEAGGGERFPSPS